MCNYNRLLLRFETSNSSKIHTSNLNQNFWHSWGWHFLCTKCPYVESCKLQIGWSRVHTSQRFLKTWHDTTSIASFHITKFKGCLNATFIQWVFVREDHGTKRSKVHQDKKNHVPRRSNRSPRQSCPTLYNTLLRAPCRLFWLVSNWKRTYHITRQHLLFHKESTLRKTNNQIELFSQYWNLVSSSHYVSVADTLDARGVLFFVAKLRIKIIARRGSRSRLRRSHSQFRYEKKTAGNLDREILRLCQGNLHTFWKKILLR